MTFDASSPGRRHRHLRGQATDGAGNSATDTAETALKDTVDPAIDLTAWDDPIFEGNVTSVDASGERPRPAPPSRSP